MAGTLIISLFLLYSFIRHLPAALGIFIQTPEPNSRSEANTYSWWLQRMKIQHNECVFGTLAMTLFNQALLLPSDNIYTWMDFQIYQEPWLCFYFQHHFFISSIFAFLHLSSLTDHVGHLKGNMLCITSQAKNMIEYGVTFWPVSDICTVWCRLRIHWF